MSHAMWSDGFRAEERAWRGVRTSDAVGSLVLGVVGFAAVLVDVIMSIQVATDQLTVRNGSITAGLVAIGLGFAAPYGAVVSWRSAADAGRPPYRRLTSAAFIGFGIAAIAVPWLLLLQTFHHPTQLVP